jgi:glycosyltransferase involved in cell wall biosynthesis
VIDYSVIVPAYQAAATLPRCLAALHDQSVAVDRYEIIVVDDGSRDETAAVADKLLGGDRSNRPAARVIRAPHGGPGQARNLGAAAARGRILLFTDADCEPAHDWLERLTAAVEADGVSGAKGAYRTHQRSWVARFVQQEYQDKYDRMLTQPAIDFVDTYSAAYRREVFEAAGGFDPALSVNEDQELSFRLASQGKHLVFVPAAVVFHQHVTSAQRYLRRKVLIGYWKARVLQRHPGKAVRDSHTPQVVKLQIGLLALALPLSLLALIAPALFSPALLLWLALLLSMLPFVAKIARRDPAIVVIAPFMIGLRALGLGLGLLAGFVNFNFRRVDQT